VPTPAIEAIRELSGRWLWLALLHSLWIGLAAAALVALAFHVCRRLSHRSRHAILLGALGMVAVGPTGLVAVQWLGRRPAGDVLTSSAPPIVIPYAHSTIKLQAPHTAPATLRSDGDPPGAPLVPSLNQLLDRVVTLAQAVRPVALAAWALAVLGLTAVLALGARGLNRLCRDAAPAPALVQTRVRRLGRLLRLGTTPEIRVHATLGEPCLCGVFRPVILLPGRWLATAGPEAIDAVIAHELAHARRSDHLVNLTQRVLEILLFFHPAVHWLSRSLRRQGELCADALAIRLTGDPLALARALESVARLRAGPSTQRSLGAALGGESTSLLPRIQELIGMTPLRPRLPVWPFAALPSAATIALVAISLGFAPDEPAPAQDAPPPPAPQGTRTEQPRPASTTPPTITPLETDPFDAQIAYEVRYLVLEGQPWRDRLQGRVTPCRTESEARGWIIDESALRDLLQNPQGNRTTSVLQAPKVTTFEFARATLLSDTDPPSLEHYPAEWWHTQNIKDDSRVARERSRLDLMGAFMPRGVRISVTLRDSDLSKAQEDNPNAETVRTPLAPGKARYQGAHDIPDGSSLLISLGQYKRRRAFRSVTSERLVVITPQRIVLEPER
jgi:Zn-dependent protease with chaperone function